MHLGLRAFLLQPCLGLRLLFRGGLLVEKMLLGGAHGQITGSGGSGSWPSGGAAGSSSLTEGGYPGAIEAD